MVDGAAKLWVKRADLILASDMALFEAELRKEEEAKPPPPTSAPVRFGVDLKGKGPLGTEPTPILNVTRNGSVWSTEANLLEGARRAWAQIEGGAPELEPPAAPGPEPTAQAREPLT